MEEPTMSFYEWMLNYPHEDTSREVLAENLQRLAQTDPRVEDIDSFFDLMTIADSLDSTAFLAVTDSLWCEYCAACNHPF